MFLEYNFRGFKVITIKYGELIALEEDRFG